MATITYKIGESEYERRMSIFERELHAHFGVLYAFAYRLTNDGTLAEDLVQETFLKAWNSIGSYEPGSNAKAWLYTICRHAFINGYRAGLRKPKTTDYDDVVANHNEDDIMQPAFNNFHEEFHGKLMGDEITFALGSLSKDQRIIVLLDLEDFTYEEIAAIVEIPIGTVRSRLNRGRSILKRKLYAYALSQGIIDRGKVGDHRMTA
jgi:RNA polymerase sigma-70 factor (ECF subfamily)